MRWVSVAEARQVDAFPVSVPDRQALVECVARSRFVGLYEGILLGKVGSPGVIVVDGRCAAVGLTPVVRSSGERGYSRGCGIVSSLADGRCGIHVVCAWRCVVAAVPKAGCGRQGKRVPRQVGPGGPACS